MSVLTDSSLRTFHPLRSCGPSLTLLAAGLVVACAGRAGVALGAPGIAAWCCAATIGAAGVAWTARTLGATPSGSLLASLVGLAAMTALAGTAGSALAATASCV